ncbi:MAG: peptidoglycan-binding protein [Candidatus Liptonbacteria bacterium]|nr:peptidoglycan-binding protein [Candidatus Liptonbacteria bacterium]
MPFSSRITLCAILAVGLFVLVGVNVNRAYAGPLTWTSDTKINLTSQSVIFTIVATSYADQLQVNATSVMVTLSSTSGGSFSISSASTSIDAPGASSNGCSGGVATASFPAPTDSTVYTISPSGGVCTATTVAAASTGSGGGGGGSSGGGGGGGSTPAPTTPAPTTPAPTTTLSKTELQAKIDALQQALQALLLKAQAPDAATSPKALPPGQLKFQKNLNVGSVAAEVKDLQTFLINSAAGPAAKELATYGATGYYGKVTKKALAEYQKSVGIVPPSGYFGPKTRAYLNALKLWQ